MDDGTKAAKVDELQHGWQRATRKWIDHPSVRTYVVLASPGAVASLAPLAPYLVDDDRKLVICGVAAGGVGTIDLETGERSASPVAVLGVTVEDMARCDQASHTFGLIVAGIAEALHVEGAPIDAVNAGDLYAVAQLLLLADPDWSDPDQLVATLNPASNSTYTPDLRGVEHRDGLPVELRRTADEVRDHLREDLAGAGPGLARAAKQGRPKGSGDTDLVRVLRDVRRQLPKAKPAEIYNGRSSDAAVLFLKQAGHLPAKTWVYDHWAETDPDSA